MRAYALIAAAAIVLASATAHAGDSRSLSTSMTTDLPNTPAAPVQPQADNSLRAYPDTASADTPRYRLPPSDAPQQNVTPHYAQRPTVVDNTPQTTQTTPPPQTTETTPPAVTTPSTNVDRPEQDTMHRAPAVHAHAQRSHRRGGQWTAGRIIAELHRYGVYW
jgi:hypothetical protein